MCIAGIHLVSSSVLYAFYLEGFTRIGIGGAKYRGDGTKGWHQGYTNRVNLGAARKEVLHAA